MKCGFCSQEIEHGTLVRLTAMGLLTVMVGMDFPFPETQGIWKPKSSVYITLLVI